MQLRSVAAHLEEVTRELHMLSGRVQACDHWLAYLERPGDGPSAPSMSPPSTFGVTALEGEPSHGD